MNTEYTKIEKQIFSLYYDRIPEEIKILDLCRGDDDYRKVYIICDSAKKIVIKDSSNTFTDTERILAWNKLIAEYNALGIYCPRFIQNKTGDIVYEYRVDERVHYVYAEDYSIYEAAEHISGIPKDENGKPCYLDDMLCSVGKVASAHFNFMPFCSAYSLLEPFSPPDTTDEGTECAVNFCDYIKNELPAYYPQAEKLLRLFYSNQTDLRSIYNSLPVSCFQADLNNSNVLLDGNNHFTGLIDFNLSGKEPVLNYSVRAALWQIHDNRLYDKDDNELFWYDKELDKLRINLFLDNIKSIQKSYRYSEIERNAFPILFRYMNSFWWQHLTEIKRIKDDGAKINMLFDWLEFQMTRDDIRIP